MLLSLSCSHGSIAEDFGLAATDGVIGGLTYAVAERLLSPSESKHAAPVDGGIP